VDGNDRFRRLEASAAGRAQAVKAAESFKRCDLCTWRRAKWWAGVSLLCEECGKGFGAPELLKPYEVSRG